MAQQVFPTKGNLINTKRSLSLAHLGFELLDRKRNILIREMMELIDRAQATQDIIDRTFSEAYFALQQANVSLGICEEIASSIEIEEGVSISYRSVMGIELPTVSLDTRLEPIPYGFEGSDSLLDTAYIKFHAVKRLTVQLAEIENSAYRLANAIKKTQKRANALKNIIIPQLEETARFITDALEEREREEFSRLKTIKKQKEKAASDEK